MERKHRFPFKSMDVYAAALDYYTWCLRILAKAGDAPFFFRNQVLRAALSILANIGEANGRWKRRGEVEQHYRYAQGSTYESAALLDALHAMGYTDGRTHAEREEQLARIAAMLTSLMRRGGRNAPPTR